MRLPLKVEVTMELTATVTLTQEVLDGIADQYPGSWEMHKDDPEELAKMVLYASVGPTCRGSNAHHEDWWDGVGNLQGLIHDMDLA